MSASAQQEIRQAIFATTWDPLEHARIAYDWGKGSLAGMSGPRVWQAEELAAIRDHLQNPDTRYTPFMDAIASGHGPGKSALIGMVTKWALDTCEDCRVVITANTEGQLRTKTAPEVSKWCKLAITRDWFSTTATAVIARQPQHERAWRADFVPWSKENSEAFAGLHNALKRIVLVFDEGSAIHDEIWEVAEGALTDEQTEIIWLAFGNPTRNVGRFRECFRKHKKFWRTRHIDSRDVEGTNKALFERWRQQYDEDSDFFKVRVKGQFPDQSAYQFFNTQKLDAARGKHLRKDQYDFAPVILSCDPAWTGDDELVIGMRQGLYHKILETLPKNDNDVLIANKLAHYEDKLLADAVFIDAGYGTGIFSAGRTIDRDWQLIWFSGKSPRPDCINHRDAMHAECRDWLDEGGVIDDDQDLYDEMVAIEVIPTLDGKIKLPPKEDIKEIIGRSPNRLDQLALTFAMPVVKKDRSPPIPGRSRMGERRAYDPYA